MQCVLGTVRPHHGSADSDGAWQAGFKLEYHQTALAARCWAGRAGDGRKAQEAGLCPAHAGNCKKSRGLEWGVLVGKASRPGRSG